MCREVARRVAPRAADHERTARLLGLVDAVVQSALQKRTAEPREAEVLGEDGGLLQEQAVEAQHRPTGLPNGVSSRFRSCDDSTTSMPFRHVIWMDSLCSVFIVF